MITKVHIQNYRTFKRLVWKPQKGMNIIVGDNETGKSTLLEAILLVLSGRVHGRWMGEELNPYWFNTRVVKEYFEAIEDGRKETPPSILIEVYFENTDPLQKIRGKNNFFKEDCPGVQLKIELDMEYIEQFREYLLNEHPPILPVEYYKIEWQGFDGNSLNRRPKGLRTSMIDGRAIYAYKGIDYQTRQILTDYVEKKERAVISVNYRHARHSLTETLFSNINKRIKEDTDHLKKYTFELQMDQSSSSGWESNVVPQVNQVPFSMAGQGQQMLMKLALALSETPDEINLLLIEEPENHLSHTSLTAAIKLIDDLSNGRQTFITTHSSFVMNRLGLDKLTFLHDGITSNFTQLSDDTIDYFKKQSGYDTLRIVLAKKLVIVEGPTDEMLFNRAYYDIYKREPIDDQIDVITQGIRNRRALELCCVLDRSVAVLRDVDKQTPDYWKQIAKEYLKENVREMFIGDNQDGKTLEPQIIAANSEEENKIREIINCPPEKELETFMTDNKTEVAWLIANSPNKIKYPKYILEAIEFVRKL